jgi:hypothetical protein
VAAELAREGKREKERAAAAASEAAPRKPEQVRKLCHVTDSSLLLFLFLTRLELTYTKVYAEGDAREGEEERCLHHGPQGVVPPVRSVVVRLPGKGNSNSHGARPVHLIITMI